MTPTPTDTAGFVSWGIVPCPATNTCLWATQEQANALVFYSAVTGGVVAPVASASSTDTELEPVDSDYDPQWHYFVQHTGHAGPSVPTDNSLLRVPAAGGEPQVVLPTLLVGAENYVVSADGTKVAYLDEAQSRSIVVATTGDHPTQTTIAEPPVDSTLQLVGWLPDDRTLVAVVPSPEDATLGRLVEFDTTAAGAALKTIFTPPRPVPYSHDACSDEQVVAAVDGETIAVAVGACSAEQEPTPQLYFVDAAGNHTAPIAVTAHPPYYGGFSVYGVHFVSDDEVVIDLGHQDCYGPGVWVDANKAGASHYVAVQGDGCGG
jgi:hypothetical protein